MALYDTIGRSYSVRRRADPRIAERVVRALGDASSVLNVGAGAGSYEPRDRRVVALEPSNVMIRQRAADAAPVVRGVAEHLPFPDRAFDAALAVLTIHHWSDLARGLSELRRIARHTVVLLTFDTSVGGFWLTDYFPEIPEMDRRAMPELSAIRRHLGNVSVFDLPVPHDCSDGFLCAYWRRPHAYLDADVRAGISVFPKLEQLDLGLAALRADLESGAWQRRYGALLQREELDVGYRLIVANRS